MSAYANDPRVVRHNAGFIYTVVAAGQEFTVHAGDGPPVREWRVYLDAAGGSPVGAYATADEAIRSLIGNPR